MTTRSRRASRAVLIALAVFFIGQAGLSVLIETVKPEWRDPEYGWRIKALTQLCLKEPDRKLIVVFGSSRTQMGFSPSDLKWSRNDQMPIVYNFGQAGSGPLQMLLNYRRIIDAGIRPDAILVELMPATLTYEGRVETFYHDTFARLGWRDLSRLENYSGSTRALCEHWITQRWLPWYSLRFLLMSHWVPSILPWQNRIDFQWRMMDRWGWARYPFDTNSESLKTAQMEQARNQYQSLLENFAVSEISRIVLNDLIQECKSRSIPIGFYLMPEDSHFRSWMLETSQVKMKTFLSALSTQNNVSICDASNWIVDEQFADGHHLLSSGARKFSERFGREFLSEWWSESCSR